MTFFREFFCLSVVIAKYLLLSFFTTKENIFVNFCHSQKWAIYIPFVEPKGHFRRHSGGLVRGTETDNMKITTRSTVDDNSSIEANLSENYSNFLPRW
jgi:hypothetical protein